MMEKRNSLSRRKVIATIGGTIIAAPYIWSNRAGSAQQLPVRTPGGSFDEVKREHVYEPFRKTTGIEIVPAAATVAKVLAMHRANQMEVGLIDTGDDTLLQLHLAGALMPIDYSAFKLTN